MLVLNKKIWSSLFQFYLTFILFLVLFSCNKNTSRTRSETISSIENHQSIITKAQKLLKEKPITINQFTAERSAGGKNDYYSEGPYWWPNPEDAVGPYIRRDGERNPQNFGGHGKALNDFGDAVTTLTAAYILEPNPNYISQIKAHLDAWFVIPESKMNPHLLYAQAIKGINTGRGIGIIDAIELIEVANSCRYLESHGLIDKQALTAYKSWFESFADWMTTHPYGIDEKNNNNNHSTWWGAQLAAYALFTNREDLLQISQEQFVSQLQIQMDSTGGFPDELTRTKPYHYTIYNLEAWTTFTLLASSNKFKLSKHTSPHGSIQKAIDFLIPYLTKQKTWPYTTALEKEVHFQAEEFLLMAYWIYNDHKYLDLFKTLPTNKHIYYPKLIVLENMLP